MRVCVVGAGSIGREFALNHFTPSATRTRVTCIVDADADRAADLAADAGSILAGAQLAVDPDARNRRYRSRPDAKIGTPVPFFTSLDVQALDLCDVVYIGTTPNSHADLCLTALGRGKHVVLEKPIAAYKADADAIVEAAEAADKDLGIKVSMNIGMRWNNALATMRSMMESGAIGQVESAAMRLGFMTWPRVWQRTQWCAERDQGGALREVGTHFFFGINELFGHGCVQRCKCTVTYDDGDDGTMAETAAKGTLVLANGIELAISLDLGTESDIYELEVVGKDRTLLLDGFTKLRYKDETDPIVTASYGRRECIESLLRAVDGEDASDIITPRQGRNAQRLLDAILASNGSWIDVAYD